MDIVMIRHGQTYDNLLGIYSRDDTRLTELGKKQIEEQKDIIDLYKISEIFVSPLIRTKETFNILKSDYINVHYDNRLKEIDLGIFKGYNYKEIEEEFPKETHLWFRNSLNYKIPKGDSVKLKYYELKFFLEEIKKRDKNILLVTHEGIIRLILSWVFDDYRLFYKFSIDNGKICKVSIVDDFKFIKGVNV